MPIKFTCPHCKRAMIVNDNLAGKKGKCKACQQILTVPMPTNAAPSAAAPADPTPAGPKSAPPPLPPSVDVEAEAAALFADEPKTEEPVEVKTIDLNCPFCDEAIQFSADLAGKRAPCPECKHIIKVPELVKKEPKDWRKADKRGPTGARLPDQPELEGAWGSATAGKVGQKALEEAGVLPKVKPPRTTWQKVRWPLVGVSAVVLLAGFGWGGYRWWSRQTVEKLLADSVAYAALPQTEKTQQAEIYLGAGEFELNRKKIGCAAGRRKHLNQALTQLQSAAPGSESDAALTDLALALIDAAGGPPETDKDKELRLPWSEIQPRLFTALNQIRAPEARRAALRAVNRKLLDRGEAPRVLTLLGQLYPASEEKKDDKAAALCDAAWELLQAKDQDKAQKAVEEALKLYDDKKPPPLRAEVVAMGLLLKHKAPEPAKDADEKQKANEQVGRVAALALKDEKWDEARKKANELEGNAKFRALLALAAAAVDHKSADAASDVEVAASAVEKAGDKAELSWPLFRLTELALSAGLPEERVQSLADAIADRPLRGRAQLAVFRARLKRSPHPIEESALDKIEATSLARALALKELARHNTRVDSGWAKNVQSWEQPRKAFGSLGAALGMQDRVGK